MINCCDVWFSRALKIAALGMVTACAATSQQPTSGPASTSDATPRALIDKYCIGCHNERLKVGGLALNNIASQSIGQNTAVWEKVVRKLLARYMPPVGLPHPDESTYNSAVSSLESSLDRIAAAKPDPGRTDTFRRLNRTEYHNAIRDLLALDIDVSSLLPSDDSSHGFDNVTVGNLSPTLLERYLAAAQKISRLAMGAPLRPEGFTVTLPPDLTQEQHLQGLPLGTRGGLAIEHEFPRDGEYEIQVRLTRDRNEHVEGLNGTHEVELMLDDERVGLFMVKPPRGSEDHHAVDQGLHVRIAVKAGPHTVAAAFPKKLSALPETERQPYQAHFNMDRHPRIQPAVYSLTINGPFDATGPGDTPSRRRILVCKPGGPGEEDVCAK